MYLLLYIAGISLTALIGLFGFQTLQLRQNKVAHLPNVTFEQVIWPIVRLVNDWLRICRSRLRTFSYPILMLFYEKLLHLLLKLTSRIASRFNYFADTIKGKAMQGR